MEQLIEAALAHMNLGHLDEVSDLHLAAKLGQLLLSQNQQLEEQIAAREQLITQQESEIQQLARVTTQLQEENHATMMACGQLEETIEEMERCNKELLTQRHADHDKIEKLSQKKSMLEDQCSHLQESYEHIEDELQKMQSTAGDFNARQKQRVREMQKSRVQKSACGDSMKSVEVNHKEDTMKHRIDVLSRDLSRYREEISDYHQKIAALEHQFTNLSHRNNELHDIVAQSLVISSRDSVISSGCSSCKHSPSLLEEIVASEITNIVDGCVTLPKSKLMEYQGLEKNLEATMPSSIKCNYPSSRTLSERLANDGLSDDISVDIYPIPEGQDKDINDYCIGCLCRQHRLRQFLRIVATNYKNTIFKCVHRILSPLMRPPQIYIGTVLLWFHQNWVRKNINPM